VFGSGIEGDQVGVVEEQFVELYQEETFEEGKCNKGIPCTYEYYLMHIYMHVSELKCL
jgi:hypothetical protein